MKYDAKWEVHTTGKLRRPRLPVWWKRAAHFNTATPKQWSKRARPRKWIMTPLSNKQTDCWKERSCCYQQTRGRGMSGFVCRERFSARVKYFMIGRCWSLITYRKKSLKTRIFSRFFIRPSHFCPSIFEDGNAEKNNITIWWKNDGKRWRKGEKRQENWDETRRRRRRWRKNCYESTGRGWSWNEQTEGTEGSWADGERRRGISHEAVSDRGVVR